MFEFQQTSGVAVYPKLANQFELLARNTTVLKHGNVAVQKGDLLHSRK